MAYSPIAVSSFLRAVLVMSVVDLAFLSRDSIIAEITLLLYPLLPP
jgi:hypothetical protein